MLNLGDPGRYVQFFAGVLKSALLPDVPRSMCAAQFNRAAKQYAWMWISHKVREMFVDPEKANLVLLEDVVKVHNRGLRRLAGCLPCDGVGTL